jgi:aryl-alcohol dehydrogenase-like predicted oxidoreductase
MRAYDDLVAQGKVGYVGCSNYPAWQLMKALAVSERAGLTKYICQQVKHATSNTRSSRLVSISRLG